MVRITKRVIRIPIPVGLHEDRDSNHYSSDSNQATRKRSEWLLNNRVIRIPPQRILIQIPVRDTLMNWFESLVKQFESLVNKKWSWEPQIRITIQRFESLMKNKWRDWSTNSNHLYSDLNHSWRTRQGDSNLWVTDSNVTPRPRKVDTWQPPRALEWVSVSWNPNKSSQGIWYPSPF